jgi:hypothetical protein
MLRLKRVLLAVVVLASVLGVSSMAMAGHEDSHDEDIQFSFGYDNLNHFLAINLGDNFTLYDCGLENGSLTATYGDANPVDGVIPVDTLKDGDDDKAFDPRVQEELPDSVVAVSDPIEYSSAEEECGVSGVVVGGPNGQVNHGQFMKAAKSLIDIKGQGCVVRYLAKSDIGRTDEIKVRTSDVDPSFEIGAGGDILFSTFEADCSRGNKNKDIEATNQGKNDRTGSPGKSGDAPGKNE